MWVAAEELRSAVPFGGFPWGRLAFAQADAPFKGLAGRLGGMPLVTFAVALCGALLAAAVPRRADRSRGPRRAVAAVVGACPRRRARRARWCRCRPTAPRSPRRWSRATSRGPGWTRSAGGRRARQPRRGDRAAGRQVEAGTEPRPDLVVWPENSTDIDPYADAAAAAAIQGAVDAVGAPTLVGAVVTNPDDPSTVLNLGIVWGPRAPRPPAGGDLRQAAPGAVRGVRPVPVAADPVDLPAGPDPARLRRRPHARGCSSSGR